MALEKSISFITPALFIKMSNPPRILIASLNVAATINIFGFEQLIECKNYM